MPASAQQFLQSIRGEADGLALGDLLARHPGVSRRTAQRWLARLLREGRVAAVGRARADAMCWRRRRRSAGRARFR